MSSGGPTASAVAACGKHFHEFWRVTGLSDRRGDGDFATHRFGAVGRSSLDEGGRATGMVDSLQTIVLRNAYSVGLFADVRHSSVGFATDDDLEMLRLFAPHIRAP
jgi:hypothetical protein